MREIQINTHRQIRLGHPKRGSAIDEEYLIEVARQRLSTLDAKLVYHDLRHTRSVVHVAAEMAHALALTPFQKQCLTLAAWFHDVGFTEGAKDHELRGTRLLNELLRVQKAPAAMVREVTKAIMSTRLGTRPLSYLGELLTDADTHHLSATNYWCYADSLKRELEETTGEQIPAKEWTRRNITFFKAHQYYSEYARAHFEAGKARNLAFLKNRHENEKAN